MSDDVRIPPALWTDPRFAQTRKRSARTALFVNLCRVMQACGQFDRLRLRREIWKINLGVSYARLDEALCDWEKDDILYPEADGEYLTLTLSAWVRQPGAAATIELYAPPRPEYASDDPEYRRKKRAEKKAQGESDAEGGADAPPSARFAESAESENTPQPTPQNGDSGEMFVPQPAPQPLIDSINLNSNSFIKEIQIESITAAESATAPRDGVEVLPFVMRLFISSGMERAQAEELIQKHGMARAREVALIISVSGQEAKRQSPGYIHAAFEAGREQYPPPKPGRVPREAQIRLGLLVEVAGAVKAESAAKVAEYKNAPQATPQNAAPRGAGGLAPIDAEAVKAGVERMRAAAAVKNVA